MTLCPLYGKAECQFYADGCLHPSRAIDYVNDAKGNVTILCRDDKGKRKVSLTMTHDEFCTVTVRYPYKEVGK